MCKINQPFVEFVTKRICAMWEGTEQQTADASRDGFQACGFMTSLRDDGCVNKGWPETNNESEKRIQAKNDETTNA